MTKRAACRQNPVIFPEESFYSAALKECSADEQLHGYKFSQQPLCLI